MDPANLVMGFSATAALAATGVWAAARLRETLAMKAYPPEGRVISVAGQTLHVVEMGLPAGSAPDLVLIHGSNGSTRDMSFALAPALSDRYRILIFDRPGLGYSAPLPLGSASITKQAQVLQAAACHLGAKRPLVLGQSYGGAVALAWATEFEAHTAAIITVSGVSHPWDTALDALYRVTSSRFGARLLVPLLTAFVSERRAKAALPAVFAPQTVPDGYSEHFGLAMSLRRGSWRHNARQRADLLSEVKSLAPKYGALTLPIEILHGTADKTVSIHIHAKKLAADVPSAHLTELQGVGHMPHQTHTQETVAAVDRAAKRAQLRKST